MFHGSSETTLTYNMAFLGSLMHLLKTNISQVCQECCPRCMCKVCSSLGQKWGNEKAITGSKIILTCPLAELSFSLSEGWAKNLKGGAKHPPGRIGLNKLCYSEAYIEKP